MAEARYAIVRVDNKCPAYENINLCNEENTTCEDCKVNKNYGDTKEQMILKVAQTITKFFFRDTSDLTKLEKNLILEVSKKHKTLAKEIVEFLGVK